MNTNRDKAAVFIIILVSISVVVLFANGAKAYEPPFGSGEILFDSNSGVELEEETITFKQFEGELWPRAKVVVEYDLKNTLQKNQNFNIFFIVPPLSAQLENAFKVTIDDRNITKLSDYKLIETPQNWTPNFDYYWKQPYGKKEYKSVTPNSEKNEIYGIEIPISINANSNARLNIEYICYGGYNKGDGYVHTIYSFIYYLTPAKFWNGKPKVNLNISLSDTTGDGLSSNIPMKEISKGNYTATLEDLPQHEWVFNYINTSGLIYGTNSASVHRGITIFISIIIFALARYAYRRYNRHSIMVLGYIASVLYFFCFVGKLQDGGIGDAFIGLFLFFILGIIIPIVYFIRRSVKKSYYE